MLALDVSPSTLCTFLKKSNFSRKKMQLVALQRDQELRATFATEVSLYPRQALLFVDERSCDVGALIHYLPPYSPDYNPIELLFSKVWLGTGT